MPIRAIAYSSGANPCGIADYHRRLSAHVPSLDRTVRLPTARVLRDRPIALFRRRLAYRRLAAAADGYDVALLQLVNTWNGFRLGEYLLPTFLNRLRTPLVVVMHEWFEAVRDETAARGLLGHPRRGVAAAIRRLDFDGLGFDAWVERMFLPRVSHVFVHAEHLRDRLVAAGVAPDRITCSVMPVFLPAAPAAASCPPELPANCRLIVLFGFPHPRKRYDVAVRALAALDKDVVMLMVGSADNQFRRRYVDELRRLTAENGTDHRFLMTGAVSEDVLAAIFARAGAALAPADYATGSASLGYLIAAGVPIVASDLPSLSALRAAGAGITTFETGNVDACVAALRGVLDDGSCQAELRQRSRRFAEVHTFARFGALVDERLRLAAEQAAVRNETGWAPVGVRP